MIKAKVTLSGNNTRKVSSNSIRDFVLLKQFNVCIHHSSIPLIKEVIWSPLPFFGSNAMLMVLLKEIQGLQAVVGFLGITGQI
jgi:hypothetical protein